MGDSVHTGDRIGPMMSAGAPTTTSHRPPLATAASRNMCSESTFER